jgi:hypothetical protein
MHRIEICPRLWKFRGDNFKMKLASLIGTLAFYTPAYSYLGRPQYFIDEVLRGFWDISSAKFKHGRAKKNVGKRLWLIGVYHTEGLFISIRGGAV